jgi:hypothetical protein
MSGRGRRVDVRVAHTVTFLLRCPRSSVPEAMRACKYTFDESASRSKQMAIRRSFAKATGGELVAPPDVILAAVTATMTTVSPLTNQTSVVRGPSTPPTTTTTTTRMATTPGGTRTTWPRPKPKLIRKLAGGMHKFRINKLATSDHAKRALKRATKLYVQEKDKKVLCNGWESCVFRRFF